MPEERTVMKVFKNIPEGYRFAAKPKRDGQNKLKMI
jgi:hypothetical protein